MKKQYQSELDQEEKTTTPATISPKPPQHTAVPPEPSLQTEPLPSSTSSIKIQKSPPSVVEDPKPSVTVPKEKINMTGL